MYGLLARLPKLRRNLSLASAMSPIPKTYAPGSHLGAPNLAALCSMKAAQVKKQGGVEEIEIVDLPVPTPKPDEILVKTEWAGVNYSRLG